MNYRLVILLLCCLCSVCSSSLSAQSTKDEYFFRRQAREELVLLRNEFRSIPIMELDSPLTLVSIGGKGLTHFQEMIRYYTDCEMVNLDYREPNGQISLSQLLREKESLIIVWRDPDIWSSLPAGIQEKWQAAVQDDIDRYQEARIVVIGTDEALTVFPGLPSAGELLLAGGETRVHEQLAAQVLMGAEGCYGRLLRDVSRFFLRGNGLRLNGGMRLSYSPPETVGIDGESFGKAIDSVIAGGIDQEAFPGCQVLIAKEGHVIFHKSYGYHTYDQTIEVSDLDLYDLASVTKVTAPLPILMKLVDEAQIDLDVPLAAYWPEFYKSDKNEISVREVLAHQAGLIPYITFYKQTQRPSGAFRGRTIKPFPDQKYSTEVFTRMYLHQRWRNRMHKGIRDSALDTRGEYRYSGLSFLLYPEILESMTNAPMEEYLKTEFLSPLGASRICFNPLQQVGLESIVPTEYDSVFRKSLVHGYVHDENAAMLGGVSGNAGLFANSHDLAKLLQMYLNNGYYGGRRYLSEDVVEEFSSYQYDGNRRGLGFDKPPLPGQSPSYVSPMASEASYGHSGFTGTFFWLDPEEELMVVFLSNRVYPTRRNRLLYELKIREQLQEACYTANPVTW